MKLFTLSLTFLMLATAGCTTENISVNTSQSWERRYSSKDTIIVNSQKIAINDEDQIWILTSKTLYNLLATANGKSITVKEESK